MCPTKSQDEEGGHTEELCRNKQHVPIRRQDSGCRMMVRKPLVPRTWVQKRARAAFCGTPRAGTHEGGTIRRRRRWAEHSSRNGGSSRCALWRGEGSLRAEGADIRIHLASGVDGEGSTTDEWQPRTQAPVTEMRSERGGSCPPRWWRGDDSRRSWTWLLRRTLGPVVAGVARVDVVARTLRCMARDGVRRVVLGWGDGAMETSVAATAIQGVSASSASPSGGVLAARSSMKWEEGREGERRKIWRRSRHLPTLPAREWLPSKLALTVRSSSSHATGVGSWTNAAPQFGRRHARQTAS
ncbi:hypothetical protein B0H17DRAFT_1151748 [Mycena rosella]|uniref:Uncharacterized protein n=1 Tax=Mycena rosella TaxID=1033263 RepID=A0AAD7BIB0_MYCRO|nr:hypothetical protein B0H17DRAFT_1151748 [Mycena rosella]